MTQSGIEPTTFRFVAQRHKYSTWTYSSMGDRD